MEHQDFRPIIWTKRNVISRTHNPAGTKVFRKLDGDDPEAPSKIEHNTKVKIQQGRSKMKMSQKQLAAKINEPVSVISSYESGKAIPSKKVLHKIQNALGIKL